MDAMSSSVRLSCLCLFELAQFLSFLEPVYLTICLPLLLPPLCTALLDLPWGVPFACLLLLHSTWFVVLLLVFLLLLLVLLLSFQNLAEKGTCHHLSELLLKAEYIPWGYNSS